MTDLEFLDRAELLLQAVELACDRINDEGEVDIDNQRVGGLIYGADDIIFEPDCVDGEVRIIGKG